MFGLYSGLLVLVGAVLGLQVSDRDSALRQFVRAHPCLAQVARTMRDGLIDIHSRLSRESDGQAPRTTGAKGLPLVPLVPPRPEGKCIAITIDDGPRPEWEQVIMELAARYDAHFTFFVVGRKCAEAPEAVPALIRQGHEVENHSWSHPDLTTCTCRRIRHEIERTSEIIFQQGGVHPKFFRAPAFKSNRAVAKVAGELNLQIVARDVSSYDWREDATVESIIERIVAHPEQESVLLFHEKERTLPALAIILEKLHAKGYHFVRLDQLTRFPAELPPEDMAYWLSPPSRVVPVLHDSLGRSRTLGDWG